MKTEPTLVSMLNEHAHYIGTRWRHRKGGEYEVLYIALREADLNLQAVYRSSATNVVFVRPLAEFVDGRFVEIDLL